MKTKVMFLLLVMLLAVAAPVYGEFLVIPQAFEYLHHANVRLEYYGNGLLFIHGLTTTTEPVPIIDTVVILQQWNNGMWNDLKSYSTKSFDSTSAVVNEEVIVPRGYNYRLRGIHKVYYVGGSENTITFTGAVYAAF